MRESIVYQEILQEGREEGRQEGEVAIILRQLNRRVGAVPTEVQERIQRLAVPQLEELGEALLDFATVEDVLRWLESADR
jgi:predicted transposase YdaD